MKNYFLKKTGVRSEPDAIRNSLIAALQRNATYKRRASYSDKVKFRKTFADHVMKYALTYCRPVSERKHIRNIIMICNIISKEHGKILLKSKLRFGTAQKAFNLYLKFLWCLDKDIAVPPHCPVDARILRKAGVKGTWTKLDSANTYMSWIKQIKNVAHNSGFNTIQEWELSIWNENF